MKSRQAKTSSAQMVPIESLQVAQVENDPMPLADWTIE